MKKYHVKRITREDVFKEDSIIIDLKRLIEMLSIELFGSENPEIDIDEFIYSHSAIYVVYRDKEMVGFSSYMINNMYGIFDKRVSNDFLFVKKRYRGTMALYLLMLQTGKIVEQLNLPLEHAYASTGSLRLGKRLKGKKQYTSYVYTVNEVLREYSELSKIVKVKD